MYNVTKSSLPFLIYQKKYGVQQICHNVITQSNTGQNPERFANVPLAVPYAGGKNKVSCKQICLWLPAASLPDLRRISHKDSCTGNRRGG